MADDGIIHSEATPNSSHFSSFPSTTWGTRDCLPAQMPSKADFSLWSFLKQCIGKELTKVAMPIHFNEPLSFLQRISEAMEYAHLIEQAAQETCSLRRLELVTAFSVSSAACNWDRLGKPFNPILGETFENQRDRYRLVCEQVSHHPPVTAFYAEGEHFKFHGNLWPKLNFWGKSAEVEPRGVITLELTPWNEVYTWNSVQCHIHNIIVGKMWVELKGKMRVTNENTGEYADLLWRPTSWLRNEWQQRVEGYVFSPKGDKVGALYGKWTEALYAVGVEEWKAQLVLLEKKKPIVRNESAPNVIGLSKKSGSNSSLNKTPVTGAVDDVNTDNLEVGDEGVVISDDSSLAVSPAPALKAIDADQSVELFDLHVAGQRILWKVTPRPANCEQYYNFTLYAMRLNELTPALKEANILPPTDSRWRTDMRFMEDGDIDRAADEKLRLEEKQRKRRNDIDAWLLQQKKTTSGGDNKSFFSKIGSRSKEENGKKVANSPGEETTPESEASVTSVEGSAPVGLKSPMWFVPGPQHNPKKQQHSWIFTGKYFQRDWSDCPDLFNE